MKFERTSVIRLTDEESNTLINAGVLLTSIFEDMEDEEYVFDLMDCDVKDMADRMKAAGTTGTIVITRR